MDDRELECFLELFGSIDITRKDWREQLKKLKLDYIKKNHPDATQQDATEEFLLVNNKEKWEEFEDMLESAEEPEIIDDTEPSYGTETEWVYVDLDDPSWHKEVDENGKVQYFRMKFTPRT